MGDKSAARATDEAAGVPMVPGIGRHRSTTPKALKLRRGRSATRS